jgi:hypothetical protein
LAGDEQGEKYKYLPVKIFSTILIFEQIHFLPYGDRNRGEERKIHTLSLYHLFSQLFQKDLVATCHVPDPILNRRDEPLEQITEVPFTLDFI